ncbi:ribosome recycling factor [Candidatus Kinetoplastidibacterium crithidiae]|uniref:Ribosome-recycling factor n=1 Tax=Candidatus Kinetoplastidibacterium crithidiae TCC036E TaxID=1208918 RepID=M1LU30_9PROT|nr:ribosome recycling factor [Candidatus Kinetoplastibacterium crithidii]AFZ82738.1 ribosome recycling factor [Candidatus Kinetoplastibacterium crithidii (ex Angomonas deanei ATCC 30255)]AGF47611.1 ribosome recycling factor [Candidatus Kinetoplastibacterium crithidii TCC036E]
MDLDSVCKSAEIKMSKSVDMLKSNLAKIRTGRAHTGILDHIKIDYYGSPSLITKIANVSLTDSRTISVTPYEKNMLSSIEKAIRESDLGLNPISMGGNSIKVPMPPLTEERRKDLVKISKSEGEESKIAIRNIRRECNEVVKKMLKEKEISENDERRVQDSIQKITDIKISEIDRIITQKESEIMVI